eukprot:1157455-Pelagomonas_calceolata.AAC.6
MEAQTAFSMSFCALHQVGVQRSTGATSRRIRDAAGQAVTFQVCGLVCCSLFTKEGPPIYKRVLFCFEHCLLQDNFIQQLLAEKCQEVQAHSSKSAAAAATHPEGGGAATPDQEANRQGGGLHDSRAVDTVEQVSCTYC